MLTPSVPPGTLLVMAHYPPVGENGAETEVSRLICDSGARYCVYGHLHGPSGRSAFNGWLENTEFACVSCDQLGFKLKELLLETGNTEG